MRKEPSALLAGGQDAKPQHALSAKNVRRGSAKDPEEWASDSQHDPSSYQGFAQAALGPDLCEPVTDIGCRPSDQIVHRHAIMQRLSRV